MRTSPLTATLALVVSALSQTVFSAEPAVRSKSPQMFTRVGADRPFFVSASAATDEQGNIRPQAFDQFTRLVLESRITANRNRLPVPRTADATGANATDLPCPTRTMSFDHFSAPHRTWQDLSDHSRAIYKGKIIAVTEGFEQATPAAILTIAIESTLRSAPVFPSEGTIHILHRQADFRIAGVRFCNAGPIAYFTPATGDQVLVFAYAPPSDTGHSFLLTAPEMVVFARAGKVFGALPLPTKAHGQSVSLDELERSIGAAMTPMEVKR